MLDIKKPLGECLFVAFDTETTGVGAGAKLVEIAGSKFRGDEFVGRFESFIDPGQPMSEEAIAVHQITDDMVRGKPAAKDALRSFFEFADDAILVAHNAPFDCGMIGLELTRSRAPVAKNPVLDSLKTSRRMYPGSTHSLDALIELIGLPPQAERHRAFADAELVRHLIRRMTETLGGDQLPLSKLLEQSGQPESIEQYLLSFPELPAPIRYLETSCRESKKANLHLLSGGNREQQRIVHPRLCYEWKGVGYLEAYCPDEGFDRLFRLDKIVKAEPGASSGFLF